MTKIRRSNFKPGRAKCSTRGSWPYWSKDATSNSWHHYYEEEATSLQGIANSNKGITSS